MKQEEMDGAEKVVAVAKVMNWDTRRGCGQVPIETAHFIAFITVGALLGRAHNQNKFGGQTVVVFETATCQGAFVVVKAQMVKVLETKLNEIEAEGVSRNYYRVKGRKVYYVEFTAEPETSRYPD